MGDEIYWKDGRCTSCGCTFAQTHKKDCIVYRTKGRDVFDLQRGHGELHSPELPVKEDEMSDKELKLDIDWANFKPHIQINIQQSKPETQMEILGSDGRKSWMTVAEFERLVFGE